MPLPWQAPARARRYAPRQRIRLLASCRRVGPASPRQETPMSQLHPAIDPDGLLEYSVVFTDRSLNHMSKAFQQVMRDISATLRDVYAADAVVVPLGVAELESMDLLGVAVAVSVSVGEPLALGVMLDVPEPLSEAVAD